MNQISYEERVVIYEKAQARFGLRAQALKALEELGEVTVELARVQNGLGSMEALAEEIADATIMLEQMRLLYDIEAQFYRCLNVWTSDPKELNAMEVLCKVIVELARVQNGLGSMEALAVAVADATLALQQTHVRYDVSEQMGRQMDAKILRLAGKLVE